MSNYSFSQGTKFMIGDTEYFVRKEMALDIEVENLSYKKIETWSRWELLKLWNEEKLFFKVVKGNEFEVELPDYDLVPEKLKLMAEERLKILAPVLNGEIISSELKSYVASLPNKISLATFYNWKKRWEQSHDIRSLISRNDLKGPRQRRSNKIAQEIARKIIDEFIYQGESYTVDYLYNEYLLRMDELNEFRIEEKKIRPVSLTTFWRIKKEIKDLLKLDVIKYGRVQANLNRNGSTSKVKVSRPLERVEIDWTPVDVLLVDPNTLKARRPWLVYAIDVFTSHPLGFFVTFDYIDAKALKQCLLHCLMPKTYIRELYPEVENEWIAYGKPETLIFDNSKVNESLDIRDACQQLGIEPQFCPIDSGNVKGTIERAFGTLNTKYIHGLKGTTFSNIFERGRYDSEGKACITMQGFIYICHIAMVDLVANDFNATKVSTPKEAWLRGLQDNPEINLTLSRTKSELKLILMSGIEYRSITNKGVVIKNEQYTSPELMSLRHRIRSEGEGSRKVRVRFDLSDMRSIYVYDHYLDKYIEACNKELGDKGLFIEYPVHYSDLQYDSTLFNQRKAKRDRRLFGRANRKIRLIQNMDKKKILKYRKLQSYTNNEEIENSDRETISYYGISTEGISHIQLGTPEAADTIQIIKEDYLDSTKRKTKKKGNTIKKKGNSKTPEITSEPKNISSSFEINIDDLPNWEVKYRKG